MMEKRIDCYICGKENLTHNELGLNKKLISRYVKKYHCLKCLAAYLKLAIDELKERIQEFKDAGCFV